MSCILDRINGADKELVKQQEFFGSPEISVCDFNPMKIEIPGFDNVWLHSEHTNETGTHKDRKALTLAYYMKMLSGHPNIEKHIPISEQVYSIITSGSAGISFGNAIQKLGGNSLKTLVGESVNQDILNALEEKGCEIHRIGLQDSELSSKDILRLTNNISGIDLTSQHDEIFITSYLQLAHNIMYGDSECFNHVITPYGTGELYNALALLALGDIEIIADYIENIAGIPYWIPYPSGKTLSLWGVTTKNPNTKMSKLFAPSLPFLPGLQSGDNKGWGSFYTLKNLLPYSNKLNNSQVVNISDNYLSQASEIFTTHGIPAESSALSSLAMLFENSDKFKRDETILLVSTGKSKH